MSSGPVARWLDTFVLNSNSKQYAEIFKKFGFDTLNEVCKLDTLQLLKMGVTQIDIEKIMENVSVLRQTLQVNLNYQTYSNNLVVDHQLDHLKNQNDMSTISTPANQKPARRTKTKSSDKQKHVNVPNVTINQVSPNMGQIPKQHANPEAAKKISNEILQMANNCQQNSKYTCMPINNNNNNQNLNYNYTNMSNMVPSMNYSNYQQNNTNNYQYNNHYHQTYRNPPPSYYNNNNSSPILSQQQQAYYANNWTHQQPQQQHQHQQHQNDYYTSHSQSQYYTNTVQSHSNDYYSNQSLNKNNSPLEYLERLALLPECQVVDPKSIVNENSQIEQAQYNYDDINKNNKRNLDLNSELSNTSSSKKVCSSTSSSNSNSPNFKQQLYVPTNSAQQSSSQQRYSNISTDSPSSSCSSTSSSSNCSNISSHQLQLSSSSTEQLGSANLIDTCNFDFLEYLPELNSNTIDQTITHVTSSFNLIDTTTNNSEGNDASQLDSVNCSNGGSVDQQYYQFNSYE